MAPASRLAAVGLAVLATASSAASTPVADQVEFGPSEAAAKQNAFQIFNAIHSAMRQWGSSLNHNGMSLFLATVPAGVTFHHGTHTPHPPPGPEWLAFEIEHAELFAHPRWQGGKPPPPSPPPPHLSSHQQHPFPNSNSNPAHHHPPPSSLSSNNNATPHRHGYLHTYLTTHPLHLLYLDGTSAGNTAMGTLDTQDLLLRLNRTAPVWDEAGRARDLCALATSWGLDGVLRMEAGFEVIKCDFARGMRLVGANRRPAERQHGHLRDVGSFEYIRAVARRYGGIGAGRVVVDWGSMVSGFWYGVELGREEGMPRLVGVGDRELKGMRGRVEEVVRERRGGGGRVVDWQGVVDLVVGRYADRLRYMAEGVESLREMQGELNGVLDTHIDYAAEDEGFQAAIRRCARDYTMAVAPETQEDHLILTAIEVVTHSICSTLFEVRKLVVEDPEAGEDSVRLAKQVFRGLMGKLRWTRWKECAACGFNEVCFVPMWPFGDKESHERPNCRNATSINKGWWEQGSRYWDSGPGVMPPPGEDAVDGDTMGDL